MTNDVEIGWRTQISTETRPWEIDLVDEMDAGDAIGSPITSTLTDLLTGVAFTAGLDGAPGGAGTTVNQTVKDLVPGHNYRLVITANMGGSKLTSTSLLLNCPY